MKYKLQIQTMYELGSRANQEDCLYPLPQELTDNARCFVLCDGMGGHDSGEVASDAVCRAMGAVAVSLNDGENPFTVENFQAALSAAYDALDARDTHAAKKMGTTMTFLAFHAGGCLVAHIGDSRVYHLRPGKGILFETRDHSLVNDLIKVGELTEEAAKDFPQKNVITRVMQPNQERRSRADIREIADVQLGDCFFMCSDGVNETMESAHIANVLLDEKYTDTEKMRIIKEVTESSRDNHTAFLIRVQSTDNREQSTDNREQSTDNREQSTDNREQSTDNRVQSTDNREQSTDNREQSTDNRAESKEQRAESKDYRAKRVAPGKAVVRGGRFRKWLLLLLALFLVSAVVAAVIKIIF